MPTTEAHAEMHAASPAALPHFLLESLRGADASLAPDENVPLHFEKVRAPPAFSLAIACDAHDAPSFAPLFAHISGLKWL